MLVIRIACPVSMQTIVCCVKLKTTCTILSLRDSGRDNSFDSSSQARKKK